MLDIDHFKRINDGHGHQAGDEVIRQVALMLGSTARGTDLPGRYGGEEFGVVLIDTDAASGRFFAERVRRAAEALAIVHEGEEIEVTLSLGLAELAPDVTDHEEWIRRADEALYASKRGGRNRATVYSEVARA